MAIKLDNRRLDYRNYYKWFEGDLRSLWNIPPTLINGLVLLNTPTDLLTQFNYFAASSRFYINGVLDSVPEELDEYFKVVENLVQHWAVTGEYCLVVQNGNYTAIRTDYVFPIRDKYDKDNITGFYFIYPKDMGKARVIEYDVKTGKAFENERTFVGNTLEDKRSGKNVDISSVHFEEVSPSYYRDIEGLVREINVRYALLQLSLNSTAIPLLQISTQTLGSGLVGPDGITPAIIEGLGKSGIGLTVPPPFTGEEGARYIERTGAGLDEAMAYIRILLGSLAVLSGVPEYVYGISLTQSTAEVERVMFMGQSRINRLERAVSNTFKQLGVDVTFPENEVRNAPTSEL